MFIELALKEMKKNKITAKKLCADLNISETTFSGWKSGRSARVEDAMKVFQYLNISADQVYRIGVTKDTLTNDEIELIKCYRCADERSKQIIKATASAAAASNLSSSREDEVI